MPELPEVETVCRGLSATIVGSQIIEVIARRRNLRIDLPEDFEAKLTGKCITQVTRRAKYILVHLQDAQILIMHLGMSGTVVIHDTLPATYRKHDHVILVFANKQAMIFHDPRRFGLMALATQATITQHPLFAELGLEPFDAVMTADYFYQILQKTTSPIKLAIMDQRKIVGVGNIYASEALFRSAIHPAKMSNTLTPKEAGILLHNIQTVLREAIESGGSTLRDYVRSSGDSGYFQHHFKVYGKANQPCPVCKNPLETLQQSSRSTFFCSNCQK